MRGRRRRDDGWDDEGRRDKRNDRRDSWSDDVPEDWNDRGRGGEPGRGGPIGQGGGAAVAGAPGSPGGDWSGGNGYAAAGNGYAAAGNGYQTGGNGYPAGSNGYPAGSNGYQRPEGQAGLSGAGYPGQGFAGQGFPGQGFAGQGVSDQGYAGQGSAGQGAASAGHGGPGYSGDGQSAAGYPGTGYDAPGYGGSQYGTAQYGTAQYGAAQYGSSQYGTSAYGTAGYGEQGGTAAGQAGTAAYGGAGYGGGRLGEPAYGAQGQPGAGYQNPGYGQRGYDAGYGSDPGYGASPGYAASSGYGSAAANGQALPSAYQGGAGIGAPGRGSGEFPDSPAATAQYGRLPSAQELEPGIPEFTELDAVASANGNAASTPRPYGRLSIFTLLDDKVAEFDRLAERAAEGVRTAEPDTLVYVIHVVPKAPMQRIIYEIYRDRAAFESHERQPHIQRFAADRRSCVLATNIIDLRLKYAKVAALGTATVPQEPQSAMEVQATRLSPALETGTRAYASAASAGSGTGGAGGFGGTGGYGGDRTWQADPGSDQYPASANGRSQFPEAGPDGWGQPSYRGQRYGGR